MIRSYEEEKKINLYCHFIKKDLFDITIPKKEVIYLQQVIPSLIQPQAKMN